MTLDFMGRRPLPARDYMVSIDVGDQPLVLGVVKLLTIYFTTRDIAPDRQGSAANEIQHNY